MDTIVGSGNHYVIQVKGNQPSLYRQLQEQLVEQLPLDEWQEEEKGHGRHTHWYVSVYDASAVPVAPEWRNLKRLVQVRRVSYGTKSKQTTHADRLYITDLASTDAQMYAKGIRAHWAIENKLHYVKDVFHNEDNNRIKAENGPLNCSTVSSWAISIHRKNGYQSIKNGQADFQANTAKFIDVFKT